MKKLFIIISIVLVAACSKDKKEEKTSGEVILSTQIMGSDPNYYVEGFSLVTGKKVSYNLTAPVIPDIVLDNIREITGEVTGANFVSPQNDAAFYKAGEFTDSNEAENFYNSITEAGNNTYIIKADSIKKNQVYIFQTRDKKYAKLLVKDYELMNGSLSNYVQITLKWTYQPTGEKTFP